ncbi:protein NLP3-like [Iris pallida]|uniref:Protein NLP3-like n=1 Tax=Iris pallida TaxID=29817 RepID=A0AAX6F767_IRIPA|nr:protein NLP3-like [Iris pallida]
MDFDLDLDLSAWSFDAISFFSSSSTASPHFASPNPPPSSPPPPPPPPLWLIEDGARDASWDLLAGNFPRTPSLCLGNLETGNGNIRGADGNQDQLQTLTAGETSVDPFLIRERLTQALRYLKESTEPQVLVQVWAPVKNGDQCVLTTSGQPFVLDPQSVGLYHYRTVSSMYMFSINGDTGGELGLPGRVFRQQMPEWTPNVQYYNSKEYPRRSHAVNYNVQGTLALPVFDPSGPSCVGVVELIMTSPKVNYAPDVDKVCKALEAVNLKSYDVLDHPSVQLVVFKNQICNEGRQSALSEILEVLTTVCEAYKLPLAHTWLPCRHRNVLAHGGGLKKSCSSFDGSCMGQVCMSTSDVAVYVIDGQMWRFRDACVEHHLQKGQGVAGRAFESRSSYFSRDITQFCKTDYPLVHYARMFGLVGCLAVCLQSTHTGTDDYILEFFLPPDCKEASEQQSLLDSLLSAMKNCFRSLKMICDVELQEGKYLEFIDVIPNENHELEPGQVHGQNCTSHIDKAPRECNPSQAINCSENAENVVLDLLTGVIAEENGNGSVHLLASTCQRKVGRKRGKAEKSISLDVLKQYFSGSLKDAAKSLGVCPTTMKRICRQHGISRWPSRKINKVNRSLSKLKRVIESVQGAEGAFDLPSFTCPIPLSVNFDDQKKSGSAQINKQSSPQNIPGADDGCSKLKAQEGIGSHPDLDINSSKSRSLSGDGSTDSPTSLESSEEVNAIACSDLKGFLIHGSTGLDNSMPDVAIEEPQGPLGGILVEDSGSSKDLRYLCNRALESSQYEQATGPSKSIPSHPTTRMQESKTVTIKASYKDDIIRFRLPCGAGVVDMNEEVAKRLKLEVGTFEIKYMDDDQEWVVLACDADLEECVEIARLSGVHIIRLLVQDVASLLGSSCGSSD